MSFSSKSASGFSFIKPAFTDFSISCLSSFTEPMHTLSSLSSVLHMGKGVPQYLERDRFQSTRFSSHFPKRPVPVASGFQLIVLLKSMSLSFCAVVFINQESRG